jgi:hypothetical protein
MTEFATYGGVDHLGTVGKVAPGLFAQEGRWWRMVYENPVGQGGHCMEPVAWVGRWKLTTSTILEPRLVSRISRQKRALEVLRP